MAQKPARGLRWLTEPSHGRGAEHWTITSAEVPRLSPGTALLRNIYVRDSHEQRARAGQPAPGGIVSPGPVIGQVLLSRTTALPRNALVLHELGWATHTVVAPGGPSVQRIPRNPSVPGYAYLGLLGLPGLTGWAGVAEVARVRPGETVLVAPAASAAGMAAAVTARSLRAGQVIGVHTEPSPPAPDIQGLYDDLVSYGDLASAHSFPWKWETRADAAAVFLGAEGLDAVLGCLRDEGRAAWGIPGAPSPERDGDPAFGMAIVRERSIALLGYRGRRYRHLSERAERCLSPAVADGTLAERDPVDVPFDDLPAFMAGASAVGAERPVARIATEITSSDGR